MVKVTSKTKKPESATKAANLMNGIIQGLGSDTYFLILLSVMGLVASWYVYRKMFSTKSKPVETLGNTETKQAPEQEKPKPDPSQGGTAVDKSSTHGTENLS